MTASTNFKKTVCLDFDGVIHEYKSKWSGPRAILDGAVPGALQRLAELARSDKFEVCIYSSRSNAIGGRRAMRRWLVGQLMLLAPNWDQAPKWWARIVAETAFADPWHDEVRWAANKLVKRIKFPRSKPAAHLTIDDRAMRFTGTFPSDEEIAAFKPWSQ